MNHVRDALTYLPMLALLAWAVSTDLRTRRIPNWLNAALILTGLTQSLLPAWPLSMGQAWAGIGVGFALTFILFVVGAMGGGDVKMFAGIGAWMGVDRVVEIFAAAAIVAMIIVLIQAISRRRLTDLMRGSAVIVMNAAARGDLSCPPEPAEKSAVHKRLPYAVPTLIGAVAVIFSSKRWI